MIAVNGAVLHSLSIKETSSETISKQRLSYTNINQEGRHVVHKIAILAGSPVFIISLYRDTSN